MVASHKAHLRPLTGLKSLDILQVCLVQGAFAIRDGARVSNQTTLRAVPDRAADFRLTPGSRGLPKATPVRCLPLDPVVGSTHWDRFPAPC